MTFQRARSDEQKEQRRQSILETAESMLTEMPVAAVTLNELSRRAGLAKSNVLRYFDSREAILLELLDDELLAWADDVDNAVVGGPDAPAGERSRALAAGVASTLAARPITGDLISAQSAVLERNVSTPVAVAHKRRTLELSHRFGATITRVLPELTDRDALEFTAAVMLLVASAWSSCSPTDEVAAAYAASPELASLQMSFDDVVTRTLTLILTGLLADKE